MRIKREVEGQLQETEFELPDEDWDAYLRNELQYELTLQWGLDTLSVTLYQLPEPRPSGSGQNIIVTHLGAMNVAIGCDTAFEAMRHMEQPLNFLKLHLEIYNTYMFPAENRS